MFATPSSTGPLLVVGRSSSRAVSAAVSARKCPDISVTSQPANIEGTPVTYVGAGFSAVATRAELTSWRRRYPMPASVPAVCGGRGGGVLERVPVSGLGSGHEAAQRSRRVLPLLRDPLPAPARVRPHRAAARVDPRRLHLRVHAGGDDPAGARRARVPAEAAARPAGPRPPGLGRRRALRHRASRPPAGAARSWRRRGSWPTCVATSPGCPWTAPGRCGRCGSSRGWPTAGSL